MTLPAPTAAQAEVIIADRDRAVAAVLAAVLAVPSRAAEALATVPRSALAAVEHSRIFDAIARLDADGQPPTFDNVRRVVASSPEAAEVLPALDALLGVYVTDATFAHRLAEAAEYGDRSATADALRHAFGELADPAVDPADTRVVLAERLSAIGRPDVADDDVLSFGDLLTMQPGGWVVPSLVPDRGVVVLWGTPKAGKSYLALSLALAVASGTRWFDRDVDGGPVLYLAGEGRDANVERVQAWHGATGDRADRLTMLTRTLSLSDPRGQARVRVLVDRLRPRMVVVDTWARYSGVRDENDAAQTSAPLAFLERLRDDYGTSSVIVHHSNADGSKERGSTALLGAVDLSLKMVRDDDARTSTLKVAAARRSVRQAAMTFAWKVAPPDYVLTLARGGLVDPDVDRIVGALKRGETRTESQVRSALGEHGTQALVADPRVVSLVVNGERLFSAADGGMESPV